MPRFVVLHHQDAPRRQSLGVAARKHSGDHFDWMFEDGGVLRVWAGPVVDLRTDTHDFEVDPLPDHRSDYLDYEGPISRNRGHVSQVIGGDYAQVSAAEGSLRFVLNWVDRGNARQAQLVIQRKCSRDERRSTRAVWRFSLSPLW